MFAELENVLYPYVVKFNEYLSNYILVFLLLGVGIWYTIKTKFVQVRCFGECLKNAFGGLIHHGKSHENGMSSFQALSTAIAAQVGTGNIVGAAGAKLIGGLGGNILDVDNCVFRDGNNVCRNNTCYKNKNCRGKRGY